MTPSPAPSPSVRPLIHVVDDDESLRSALLDLLRAAGFDARGYGSAGEFLLQPIDGRPGCLLLDVRLPGPSGFDVQAAFQSRGIALPIVFLTGYADVPSSVRAMRAGAVDFLEKPVGREALFDAIARALGSHAQQRAVREAQRQRETQLDSLTARERDVFEQVVAGCRSREIAESLGISLRTVKAYRAQVMEKLCVSSPAELGRLAGERSTRD